MNLYLNLLSFKMTDNTYKIKSIEISTDIGKRLYCRFSDFDNDKVVIRNSSNKLLLREIDDEFAPHILTDHVEERNKEYRVTGSTDFIREKVIFWLGTLGKEIKTVVIDENVYEFTDFFDFINGNTRLDVRNIIGGLFILPYPIILNQSIADKYSLEINEAMNIDKRKQLNLFGKESEYTPTEYLKWLYHKLYE